MKTIQIDSYMNCVSFINVKKILFLIIELNQTHNQRWKFKSLVLMSLTLFRLTENNKSEKSWFTELKLRLPVSFSKHIRV